MPFFFFFFFKVKSVLMERKDRLSSLHRLSVVNLNSHEILDAPVYHDFYARLAQLATWACGTSQSVKRENTRTREL